MKALYVHKNWYVILLGIIVLFFTAYIWAPLLYVCIGLFLVFIVLSLVDIALLYKQSNLISIERKIPSVFHLGDFNDVAIVMKNHTNIKLSIEVIDEIPEVFQMRNFEIKAQLQPLEQRTLTYAIKAIRRGEYTFRNVLVFASSPLRLFTRKVAMEEYDFIKVYPSTKLFKKFQLLANAHQYAAQGNRLMLKRGRSMEFDQIKEYIIGDDMRSVNWKATARKGNIMVNNYIDEKSQNIYNVIDGGRLMQYAFDGLTLLDYAINASLLLSKLILLKDDKVGLVIYNDAVKSFIASDKKVGQLQRINQALYKFQSYFKDSSMEHLSSAIAYKIRQRSLLIIYTNFESKISFDRQLPYFKQLAKKHLLMVVFFENITVSNVAKQQNENLKDIYIGTIAEKYIYEKKQIVKQLHNAGILSLYTTPDELQTEVVNKYLKLKSSQMI